MTTTTIMLYVEKVKENADFWEKYLDFKETERFDFGDSISIVLAVSPTCNLQLFNIDFIKKNSPEVAAHKPSLLFDIANFEELHDRFIRDNHTVGDIMMVGDARTFNFPDVDGNYYAIKERKG